MNLGVFAIFSFNVCTEAVSVSPFVNLQRMATQCLFSLCLKQLLQSKAVQNADEQKSFLTFAVLLAYCRLQLYKISMGKLPTQKSEYISFDVFCGCAMVVQNKIGRLSVPGTGK